MKGLVELNGMDFGNAFIDVIITDKDGVGHRHKLRNPTFTFIEDREPARRSKKVDVPTESWQKEVERRLEKIEELLLELSPKNITKDNVGKLSNLVFNID